MDKAFIPGMPKGVIIALSAAMLVIALSACTKRTSVSNWQKSGISQEEKAADIGECRRFARRETEREAGQPGTANSADPLSGSQSYGRLTTSYDLGKYQDRMFAHCMKQLGYQAVSRK
jgi:flagellar biosynthesis component FlhA